MANEQQGRTVSRFLQTRAAGWLCTAIICLPPLSLLFESHAEFGAVDWPNHVWLTRYYGEFFRSHHWFPEVLNTDQLSGMPYPVFYGFLLYPWAGLLSLLGGPDLAIRAAVGGVLVLQCRHVYGLIYDLTKARSLAWVIAALTTWATYALTNLYNRSALTEFIAVALITCATCDYLRWLSARPGVPVASLKVESFLFYALGAGAHPLTAVFGFLFLAVLTLAVWPFHPQRGRVLATLAFAAVAVSLVLSPWLYATLRFHRSLDIQQSMQRIVHFPASIDSLASRLAPVPYDSRVPAGGAATMDRNATPYLDAQVNIGLLVWAMYLSGRLIRERRSAGKAHSPGTSLWGTAVICFLFSFLISVVPVLWKFLPLFFHNLQFAYRLVSYQNLALLAAIAGVLIAFPPPPARWKTRASLFVLAGTLALGAVGLVIKLRHAGAVKHIPDLAELAARQNPDGAMNLPGSFFGWSAYAVTGGRSMETDAERVVLPVGTGPDFGRVGAARTMLPQPKVVGIHIQPFPWNHVIVDGRELGPGEAQLEPNGHILALSAGNHEIEYRWQPDPTWVWLSLLSFVSVAIWVLLAVVLRLVKGRRAPAAQP
jgi:hypothetical protein